MPFRSQSIQKANFSTIHAIWPGRENREDAPGHFAAGCFVVQDNRVPIVIKLEKFKRIGSSWLWVSQGCLIGQHNEACSAQRCKLFPFVGEAPALR